MSIVKFTETVYSGSGKTGIITPDADGYYTLVVGALNSYNSANEFYTAEKAVALFDNSSHFQRRVKAGALYSELGHPKKEAGQSNQDFYRRIVTIDEKNVCGHFSEISLDLDFGKKHPELNSPDLIGIIGKVKPAGSKANALQLALENPKQNAAFSVRGLTENKFNNGRVERELTDIITFDHVIEPGISIADKIMAPGLESRLNANNRIHEVTDAIIDKAALKRVLTDNLTRVGMESSYDMFRDMLSRMETKQVGNRLTNW